MAEKKSEPKKEKSYDDFHKEVHPQVEFIHEYTARTRDKNNAIIKEANEAIDYQFKSIGDDDGIVRDKYLEKIMEGIEKHTKDIKIELGSKRNKQLEDRLRKSLGIIGKEQVERILKGAGSKYDDEMLRSEMEQALSQFSQSHYAGIAQDYSLSKEGRAHVVKYLGLEERINVDMLTPEHMARLMATHGATKGEIHTTQIPMELRKGGKPKESNGKNKNK